MTSSEFADPRQEDNRRDDFMLSGLAAEYHLPVGLYWQTDASSRALLTESGEQLVLQSGVRVAWMVSDRWYAATSLTHQANAPGRGLERKVQLWDIRHDASLSYFLEDDWALTLGWQLSQKHSPTSYGRSESVSLGVSYRLAGLLGAPGIFDTMRLMPAR